MLLVCPHCETHFQVADSAIGNGRTVRCARCRESWFAAPEPAFVEAMAGGESMAFPAAPAEDRFDAAPVDVEDSPPLAAEAPPEIVISADERFEPDAFPTPPIDEAAPRAPARKPAMLRQYKIPRPVAIVLVAAVAAAVTIVGLRESIVRLMPDLAGGYAAIGLPVNLRGLEFREVRTMQEIQDGIPVLVIEGEIVNVAKHPVEVPRVRIAVLGAGKQELYAWTTLLPRSVLGESEKVSFKSRLASPPPNGQEVLVRFLTRNDLTGG
jgi:predicted Zn finger-like uncharacterized protein